MPFSSSWTLNSGIINFLARRMSIDSCCWSDAHHAVPQFRRVAQFPEVRMTMFAPSQVSSEQFSFTLLTDSSSASVQCVNIISASIQPTATQLSVTPSSQASVNNSGWSFWMSSELMPPILAFPMMQHSLKDEFEGYKLNGSYVL